MSLQRFRKPRNKILPLIAFFLVLISTLITRGIKTLPGNISKSFPTEINQSVQNIFVKRVVDGDTLLLENGDRVRLIGVDTPESSANPKALRDSRTSGQDIRTITQMGQEAKNFMKNLLEGQRIHLEFDVQQRDKYGRLLAYVYKLVCEGECKHENISGQEYVKLNDGVYVFINATILKSGYGSPMTIPPNVRYVNVFKKLYKEAREEELGLWHPKPSAVAKGPLQ